MSQKNYSLIADYADRHDISVSTPFDGRITVIVDDLYRVHIDAGPHDSIFLMYRLATLPPKGAEQDEWLLKVGKLAVGTLNTHSATCVVDQRETALWLQQTVLPNNGASIDKSLGEFVNALAFWVGVLPRSV